MNFEIILLAAASSLDAFVAGISYGTNKIKIPFLSAVIIDIITSGSLVAALLAGNVIKDFISVPVTSLICRVILFTIGITKLFDFFIKSFIKEKNKKVISFHIMDICFLLEVYCDSTKADYDLSKTLSIAEAAALGIALSPDGLAAGFGVGLTGISYIHLAVTALIVNLSAILCGSITGRKISQKTDFDFNWVSGILLIALAFLR